MIWTQDCLCFTLRLLERLAGDWAFRPENWHPVQTYASYTVLSHKMREKIRFPHAYAQGSFSPSDEAVELLFQGG